MIEIDCTQCHRPGRWEPHWPAVVHDHGECRLPPRVQTPSLKPSGWTDKHRYRPLR